MMTELEKYYNKFNEEKRLKSRHGQVEFITSMKYIHKYLPKREHGQVKILDVGAGTGRYSVALAEEGYDVTAVELVKYNLGILNCILGGVICKPFYTFISLCCGSIRTGKTFAGALRDEAYCTIFVWNENLDKKLLILIEGIGVHRFDGG